MRISFLLYTSSSEVFSTYSYFVPVFHVHSMMHIKKQGESYTSGNVSTCLAERGGGVTEMQ
jgi:hypothetical protein